MFKHSWLTTLGWATSTLPSAIAHGSNPRQVTHQRLKLRFQGLAVGNLSCSRIIYPFGHSMSQKIVNFLSQGTGSHPEHQKQGMFSVEKRPEKSTSADPSLQVLNQVAILQLLDIALFSLEKESFRKIFCWRSQPIFHKFRKQDKMHRGKKTGKSGKRTQKKKTSLAKWIIWPKFNAKISG